MQLPFTYNNCTLVLDECVTRRVVITSDALRYIHSIDVPGLGPGAIDQAIRAYTRKADARLVTRDFESTCECLLQNTKVAINFKGNILVIELKGILTLGRDIPERIKILRTWRTNQPKSRLSKKEKQMQICAKCATLLHAEKMTKRARFKLALDILRDRKT
jgi:hypothetical protein